jgi:cell division protein FtsN
MARRRSKPSGLPYLFVGLTLGLAVAAGVYFSDLRSGAGLPQTVERVSRPREGTAPAVSAESRQADTAARASTSAPSAASASSAANTASTTSSAARAATGARPAAGASAEPATNEPRFDFYEILPQYEVTVPDDADAPAASSAARARAAGNTTANTAAPAATTAAPVAAPGSYVLQTGSFRSHADADRMQASLALLGVESRIQKVAIDSGEFHRVRIGPISNLDELNRIRNVLSQAGIDSLMMKVD